MPAKGKALLDLTKFKLPSGGPLAFPICEAKVTGLPETKFLGNAFYYNHQNALSNFFFL